MDQLQTVHFDIQVFAWHGSGILDKAFHSCFFSRWTLTFEICCRWSSRRSNHENKNNRNKKFPLFGTCSLEQSTLTIAWLFSDLWKFQKDYWKLACFKLTDSRRALRAPMWCFSLIGAFSTNVCIIIINTTGVLSWLILYTVEIDGLFLNWGHLTLRWNKRSVQVQWFRRWISVTRNVLVWISTNRMLRSLLITNLAIPIQLLRTNLKGINTMVKRRRYIRASERLFLEKISNPWWKIFFFRICKRYY